ncbi:cupin domain-containing protein [Brumimicrobium aurantiacum]|uniref:Cupin domain-containing protein n=1 Tax=Brumimicrobium aurantiacum TaxID=1737063 RepID=A0A3E1EYQ6_9FLAO|nr:cupin domain-containing protein [Brumimicrobium aurantiacum]RFC54686.1 cupin domain-containing protein [Brumimicrobium aurantiacum]
MKKTTFLDGINFTNDKVSISVILETPFAKEIRIVFKEGQLMKEHKAAYPITVHLLEGEIEFGVQGAKHNLVKGDILTLEENVPHDLKALKNSVVRLSLSKHDRIERVNNIVENK